MGTHTSRQTRSGDLSAPVALNWAVIADTQGNSVNAADFPGDVYPSGTATIPANATYVDITFSSKPDVVVETDETGLLVVTSTQSGVTITGSPQRFTISNDDTSGPGSNVVYGPQTTTDTGYVPVTSNKQQILCNISDTAFSFWFGNQAGTDGVLAEHVGFGSVVFSDFSGGTKTGINTTKKWVSGDTIPANTATVVTHLPDQHSISINTGGVDRGLLSYYDASGQVAKTGTFARLRHDPATTATIKNLA